MQIGIDSFAAVISDPKTGVAITPAQRLGNLLEEITLADEVGVDVFGVGEHHRPEFLDSAPTIILAAAAARTKRIRLSSAVTVLSASDPVRVFQEFATLDLLSQGRADIVAGRGSFTEAYPLFGLALQDYDSLFAEKLDLLLKLREDTHVRWSGQHRPALTGQGVYPRPLQDPLPVWLGVGGTPESFVRAGRLGLPLMVAIIGGEPHRFRPLIDLYRQAGLQAGHPPEQLKVGLHCPGFLADTTEEAADVFYPGYAYMFTLIGRERGWPPTTRAQFDALRGPTGALFIGDPETVATKILRTHEALGGIARLNMQMTVAALPHGRMRRAIELLGTRVAPLVREALATSMRIAAIILSLAFLAGCGKQAAPPAPPTPRVVVAKPVLKQIVEHSEYTGRLAAVEEVEIRPRVSGYIFEIDFKDGTLVKKGDLLFVIDPRPYQASLGQAQGQLKEAVAAKALTDSNFERAKTLDATRVSSKQEFDTATTNRNQSDAKVATAQAAVDSAQLNLDFTRVTAPIAGRVSREQVTVGNLVASDTTLLTTIVSVDPVYAYADVDERTVIAYKKMIREGKVKDARETTVEVGIALAGEKDFPHKGVIDFVDNKIASATGTLSIRGSFPNVDDSLLPGMFIRMEIPTSPAHDGLLVTDRAVGSDQGQKFLLVVNGDKVMQKPITLGPVIDGLRVVVKGIDPGDQVIVSGTLKAPPGSQVQVEQGDMAKYASDELEAALMANGNGK